jgi:hypothetical protein
MVSIPKISALFETSLASAMTAAAASFSVVSGTDRDGNALSGLYGFIIDEGTADEEFVVGTISSTTVTITYRGCDADDPTTEVSANKKAHRRGASVKITDYPILAYLRNILNAETGYTLPNPLRYTAGVTPSDNSDLADKEYVDGVAVAGASNANTTTKGIVEEATQAEVDARTTTGGTGAKLFAPLDKIRASLYHDYAADAGSNDTYVITITPAPTAYTTGMVIAFKVATANTGACTINVNSLGAKSLKVYGGYDPQDNYLKAGAFVIAVYDGTNFRIMSVGDKPLISQSGEELYGASSGGSDTYAITLAPAPAAYATGMVVRFKADVANTGAATLNVNALGAKSILRADSSALADGDIAANQFVQVIYDGTNMLLLSPVANAPIYKNNTTTKNAADASTTQNIAHGLGRAPRKVRIKAILFSPTGADATQAFAYAETVYNGTTQSSISNYPTTAGPTYVSATTFTLNGAANNGTQVGVVTFDATNIIITWTKTGSPTGTFQLLWEAEA